MGEPFKFFTLEWLFTTLIVMIAFSPVGAQIYTYVDEKGIIHFTNVPAKQTNAKVTPQALTVLKKELQKNRPKFFMSAYPSGYRSFIYASSVPYSSYVSSGSMRLEAMKPVSASPTPYEKALDPYINALSSAYGLDPKLVKAVIKAESAFNPSATSPKGAMGLMQLMPGTAMDMGVSDPYHPIQNLKGGIGYLKEMLRLFDNNLVLALAAYNAGPNAVKQYGGVPPYEETRQYIQRVLQYYSHYKATP
ncbi:MAG: lytic transglycosylase domain-containing protein [Syntrophobacterales bacterium]|nr:lytic transglycosylase domain-containing protein [Syntrophobacterales bacterium]